MARIDAKELPALLRAIEVYEGRQLTRLAMKLMALTFVRTSELIGARWEEFDLQMQMMEAEASARKRAEFKREMELAYEFMCERRRAKRRLAGGK
jgi:integrase